MEPAGWRDETAGMAKTPQGDPRPGRARNIPSLDGLRAVSILFVLVNHALLLNEAGAPGLTVGHMIAALVGNGTLGVKIFFVISGFLITTLLLKEQRARGGISLKRFYFKRFFRIFPAYYALIFVVGVLAFFGWMTVMPKEFLHAVTFTWIYNFAPWNWCFTHTWSLSVEEQFYLMWPLALVALGSRWAVGLALIFITVSPFARLGLLWTKHGVIHGISYFLSAGNFDTLMCGCLLALLWDGEGLQTFFMIRVKTPVIVLATFAVVAVSSMGFTNAFLATNVLVTMFKDTIVGLGVAGIMGYLIVRPSCAVGRLLNSPPFVFAGTISYSLYLWQQLFLTPHPPANLLQRFPINLMALAVVALASFYLVERPLIRLRVRYFR